MKKISFIFAALLFLPGLSFGQKHPDSPAHSENLGLNFYVGFLTPEPSAERAPIVFGPVKWSSNAIGTVQARMWNVNTVVEFQTSPDRQSFQTIFVNPDQPSAPQLWDVWRHRHGYLKLSNGYVWNTLEDHREPLQREDGLFFDHFLKDVWTFWTFERLPNHLKNSPAQDMPPAVAGGFKETIQVTYDSAGLLKPAACSLRVHVWELPVHLSFEAHPSTAPAREGPPTYKYRWTFDMNAWRKMHGYHKDFWGYGWERNFPRSAPLTDGEGEKLDELLDRTVCYWMDVMAEQIAADADYKLSQALKKL